MDNTKFSPINFPYGYSFIESSYSNRNFPTSATFGEPNINNDQMLNLKHINLVPSLYNNVTLPEIGKINTSSVNKLDTYFLNQLNKNVEYPQGISNFSNITEYGNTDLQSERPRQVTPNNYIQLASESLHVFPDLLMSVFFSDDNLNHLRNTVVNKVKEITSESGVAGTSEGVTIMTPNMDDFFNYLVNVYQNYKIYNGSICFIKNINTTESVKAELTKLNSNVLQEYVSKMVSQINMYIYYYKDASQLPEQLSLPVSNSMKGSKTLEYNVGFKSGNSLGIASYSQVGNIN
jgi:hypothetical protein